MDLHHLFLLQLRDVLLQVVAKLEKKIKKERIVVRKLILIGCWCQEMLFLYFENLILVCPCFFDSECYQMIEKFLHSHVTASTG